MTTRSHSPQTRSQKHSKKPLTSRRNLLLAVFAAGMTEVAQQKITIIEGVRGFMSTSLLDMISQGTLLPYFTCTALLASAVFTGILHAISSCQTR